MKESNKPKLRFPGFTDAWEQEELRNYLIESKILGNSGNIAKKMTVKLWGKGIVEKRETEGSQLTQYYIRKAGQFIYSKLDFLNAAFAIIPKEFNGYESTADLPAFDLKGIDPLFLLYSVNQKKFYLYQGMIADGSRKAKRIHVNTFLSMSISLPSLSEQTQIGNFFQKFDELITLHQRKLENLKKQKKSLLQKMFPKNGEQFPEIRFPNYTDAWEQVKLGEICNTYSGGTPNVKIEEYYTGDIPFIRSAEIHSTSTELYITEMGLKNSSAKFVSKGDILYALYGATSGEVAISKIDGAINQAILAIKPSKKYYNNYLLYWLKNNKQYIVGKFLQGGQGNLSASILKELYISTTSYHEQIQIGNFFQKFDELITLHQRKLDNLQKLKKGLLQQMFV